MTLPNVSSWHRAALRGAFGRGQGRLVELTPLMREIACKALNEDLAERIRAVLAATGSLREVRLFGGLCFMLNGNMVAGTSKRGLLVRVGKGEHARALVPCVIGQFATELGERHILQAFDPSVV